MRAIEGGQYVPSSLTDVMDDLTVHVPEAGPIDVAPVQGRLVADNNHPDMVLIKVPESCQAIWAELKFIPALDVVTAIPIDNPIPVEKQKAPGGDLRVPNPAQHSEGIHAVFLENGSEALCILALGTYNGNGIILYCVVEQRRHVTSSC